LTHNTTFVSSHSDFFGFSNFFYWVSITFVKAAYNNERIAACRQEIS